MVIEAYAAWAITGFNIALWLLTIAHRRLSPLAKAYFGWTLFVTLWSFGYGITLSGWLDYEPTLLWNRWCQAMATLVGPVFFRFSTLVAGEGPQHQRYYRWLLLIGLAVAAGVMFSPLFVEGLWSFGRYRFQPDGGPLYGLFTGYFWWHGGAASGKRY